MVAHGIVELVASEYAGSTWLETVEARVCQGDNVRVMGIDYGGHVKACRDLAGKYQVSMVISKATGSIWFIQQPQKETRRKSDLRALSLLSRRNSVKAARLVKQTRNGYGTENRR